MYRRQFHIAWNINFGTFFVNYLHYFFHLTFCLKCWPNQEKKKKTHKRELWRRIYLFVFAMPSLSDVLQIKKGGGSSARGKTKLRPSFLSVITLLPLPTPNPLSLLSLSLFFPAPYCDFDKWQCKKRIYVGSWRLAHYHKQNRALSLRRQGAIEKVFECDAWVKNHSWRSEDTVMLGQGWIKACGEPGEDTQGWMRRI